MNHVVGQYLETLTSRTRHKPCAPPGSRVKVVKVDPSDKTYLVHVEETGTTGWVGEDDVVPTPSPDWIRFIAPRIDPRDHELLLATDLPSLFVVPDCARERVVLKLEAGAEVLRAAHDLVAGRNASRRGGAS